MSLQFDQHQQYHHRHRSQNGPARQRRRDRRAAEREAALAEEAVAKEKDEESSGVTENVDTIKNSETKAAEDVSDEFCPDEQYELVEKLLTNDNSDIFRVIFSDITSQDEEILDNLNELINCSMEKANVE